MVVSPTTENCLFCVKWFLNILRKQALWILPLEKSYSSGRISSHSPKDFCGYWPCCPALVVVKGVGDKCYAVAWSWEVICSSNREVMVPAKCWQVICLQLRQQSSSSSGLLCCCCWTSLSSWYSVWVLLCKVKWHKRVSSRVSLPQSPV